MPSLGSVVWELEWQYADKPKKIRRLLEEGWEPFGVAPCNPEFSKEVIYFRRMVIRDEQ